MFPELHNIDYASVSLLMCLDDDRPRGKRKTSEGLVGNVQKAVSKEVERRGIKRCSQGCPVRLLRSKTRSGANATTTRRESNTRRKNSRNVRNGRGKTLDSDVVVDLGTAPERPETEIEQHNSKEGPGSPRGNNEIVAVGNSQLQHDRVKLTEVDYINGAIKKKRDLIECPACKAAGGMRKTEGRR